MFVQKVHVFQAVFTECHSLSMTWNIIDVFWLWLRRTMLVVSIMMNNQESSFSSRQNLFWWTIREVVYFLGFNVYMCMQNWYCQSSILTCILVPYTVQRRTFSTLWTFCFSKTVNRFMILQIFNEIDINYSMRLWAFVIKCQSYAMFIPLQPISVLSI